MERNALNTLVGEGLSESRVSLMRELDVEICRAGSRPNTFLGERYASLRDHKMQIEREFDELHLKRYLHNAPKQSKEVVALRVAAIGGLKKGILPKIKSGTSTVPTTNKIQPGREVYFDGAFKNFQEFVQK